MSEEYEAQIAMTESVIKKKKKKKKKKSDRLEDRVKGVDLKDWTVYPPANIHGKN